jgi:chaperonin GroES
MKPLRDLVLVKAAEAKKTTDSGFYLSENWKTLPLDGEVLAVGPLVKNVKVGDKIGFARYGTVILPDNERLCKESHILWLS